MDDDVGCSQRTSGLSNVGLSPSISWHVGFRYLEELCLNRVTVDGELVEQLLANCPKLERLVLEEARTLTRFRVSGRSLKLKYLRILWCDDLEYVEIYDTDLVSFTFVGMRMPVCLDKLPQLSEVSIRGSSLEQLHVMLPPRLSSLPCVQILKLEFFRLLSENLQIRQLPKLTSVKQLILRVPVFKEASLLPLTLVIEACPCVRSFVLELMYPDDMLCRQRKLKRVDGPPHRYLKEVEFHNYYGRPCDLELVIYFVDNAIALEKLVVSPCEEEMVTVGERRMLKKLKEPRERAWQQLKGKLPSKIDLVIN
ncbi:hypothetical protein ACJRO7_022903 [Eucalyptus globulus]|uniref:At1g61320/AtMIF1 LRR domain-containing protein n=1 Tax=Eucalyptus globulus TaxID=34317 RepID=A0ABD3K182_EUCGL